ncbi:hypothetical protein ABZP36_003766 [Zizania latifolia]
MPSHSIALRLQLLPAAIVRSTGWSINQISSEGELTAKADTYSFGVLVLEIVSSRKNTDLSLPNEMQCLPEHAWRLYEQSKILELVDTKVKADAAAGDVGGCGADADAHHEDDRSVHPSGAGEAGVPGQEKPRGQARWWLRRHGGRDGVDAVLAQHAVTGGRQAVRRELVYIMMAHLIGVVVDTIQARSSIEVAFATPKW